MRKLLRTIGVMLALGVPSVLQAACPSPPLTAEVTGEFNQWLNQTRRGKGLRTIALSETLNKVALDHACFLAEKDKLSHKGRLGRGLKSRLNRAGYRLSLAVENTALSSRPFSSDVPEMLWSKSAQHRSNMLNPSITQMGLGVASGNGKYYYVFIGAMPR